MAENNNDESEIIPQVQLLASCDSSGVTFIHEDTPLNIEENGLVEISYINISEDVMVSEFDLHGSMIIEDDNSRQSSENFEVEDVDDFDDVDLNVDEEQKTITNDFLEGKISFQEFINRVECSEDAQSSIEELSDESEDESRLNQSSKDPDYLPEGFKFQIKPKHFKTKSSKELQPVQENAISAERNQTSKIQDLAGTQIKKSKRSTRVMKRLPANLLGLMGEANLRYARNEKQDAINLCMEVIRQAPNYAEPFQALSMFYEDLGEYEKSYQLSLIAAYLSPQDADEWLRLAEVCLSRKDELQASKCLAKAVQADPSNIQIHQSRCELLESMGAHKDLLKACLTMLRCVQPENDQQMVEWVELAVRIARMHHASGHLHSASRALSNVLVTCSRHFALEHYNLLLELQILTKHYLDAIKVLNRYCGVVFDVKLIDEIDLEEAETMEITQELPLDIVSKLCIALTYSRKKTFAFPLIKMFLESDVETFGDIYLDVAEALVENDFHEEALKLLEVLTHSKSFCLAAVWLKYANSLSALDLTDEAIAAFRHVINLVPSNEDARISLAELLTKLGRHEEALEAVTQDSEASRIEASVLHHKCILLLKEERWNPFIAAYKLLMMRHARNIRSKDEIYKACGAKKIGWESEEESADEELEFGTSSVELLEEYRLLRLAAEYLFKERRLVELERICFMALTSPLFRKKREVYREIQFLTLQVCLSKGDSYYAYNLARGLLLRGNNLYNNRVWNLLIQVIMRGDDVRYNRFLVRLLLKHPEHVCLSVLNGHACVASGTYKYALDEYMSACKMEPDNPLFLLLSSIVLVQLTCQKFSSGKHSLVTQASSFFDAYLRTRGECQETYYNIGRGMHQLGLLAQALNFYKKALQLKPSVTKGENTQVFDLSREIAFNLSLIYRSADFSGSSTDVARLYLDRYVTI